MNFKSLLEQYSFEEIFSDFIRLWKINSPELTERLDKNGWKKIYHGIQSLNANLQIIIYCWFADRKDVVPCLI